MKAINGILVLALLLISNQAFSDTASEVEAENLLNTMQMESLLQNSIAQTLEMQLRQNPSLAPFRDVMLEFLNKHMSYENLKPDFIRIYSEAFTASELRDITAFYQTPTGAKTLRLMPTLMAQGGQIGAQKVNQNMPELQRMIKEKAAQLKNNQNN